jgi:hypothetical protein
MNEDKDKKPREFRAGDGTNLEAIICGAMFFGRWREVRLTGQEILGLALTVERSVRLGSREMMQGKGPSKGNTNI